MDDAGKQLAEKNAKEYARAMDDMRIFGCGYIRVDSDGSLNRISIQEVESDYLQVGWNNVKKSIAKAIDG